MGGVFEGDCIAVDLWYSKLECVFGVGGGVENVVCVSTNVLIARCSYRSDVFSAAIVGQVLMEPGRLQ